MRTRKQRPLVEEKTTAMPSSSPASTERFSSRVEAYLKYRPHYPEEIIPALRKLTGLDPAHVIADIGSGTGFSAELFLRNGNRVYGVEQNEAMRTAGEAYLASYKNFRSVAGTAEATTLPNASIDLILAGQAFHWFKLDEAYREFKRILRPGGWLIILWNDRQTDTTPFLVEYEQLLLEFGTDYTVVNHRNFELRSAPDSNITHSNRERTREFFHGNPIHELEFENIQRFDLEGAKGRLVSSSYVPESGDSMYEPMLRRLHEIFERHAINGMIEMRYTCLVYAGKL